HILRQRSPGGSLAFHDGLCVRLLDVDPGLRKVYPCESLLVDRRSHLVRHPLAGLHEQVDMMRISYAAAARGCFVHALLLTVSLWIWGLGGWKHLPWLPPDFDLISWFVLLGIWPVWGCFLWKRSGGKLWPVISPMLAGCLVLMPAFFLLFVLYTLR